MRWSGGGLGMSRLLESGCLCFAPLMLVLGVWGVPAASQQPLRTLLVGVDMRSVVSLDGPWHYLVDPPPAKALYAADGTLQDRTYALNTHPNLYDGPHNAEYDFATAPTMHVPGDWNTQDPTLFRFEGAVWFQRDFGFQPQPGRRTFLHVGAANYKSFVWVNGKRICEHEGGFTPFDCEVTGALVEGKNFVVIAVDSTREVDGIPSVDIDWFNYGGLTRDVSLVTVPARFIDDYDVHLKHGSSFAPGDARTLAGYVHVEGAEAGVPVTVRVPEAGVAITVRTDGQGRAPFEVRAASLRLWSPETPKLYAVEVASGEDSITDRIGFRDIRVEGTRLLLNGKAIFLQGANMHAEAPYRTGRAYSQEDADNIFGFLREMHANFVRLSHYPHEERMERTADRDGIMIWSEIPLWQRISFEKPAVYAKAAAMLNEMIRRDRNKASVILWSISNETPNHATRTEFLTRLAAEARQLDGTRPITSALVGPRREGNEMRQDDPLVNALDVVGQNEYVGWYEGRPEDADNISWVLPQKPVLMSEFGAEAKQGIHGGKDERWAEEQQVNVFEHQFVMINKIPQVRGLVPWVLMDFRPPTRNIPVLQDGFNRKGLIDEHGVKKQAFFLFQQTYEKRSVGKAE